jgi:hypothetical protein
MREAADYIERLRADVWRLKAERDELLTNLRAERDELLVALKAIYEDTDDLAIRDIAEAARAKVEGGK